MVLGARVETAARVDMAGLALLVVAAEEARDGAPTAAARVVTAAQVVQVAAAVADVVAFPTAFTCTVLMDWTFLAGRSHTTGAPREWEASEVWVESLRGRVVNPVSRDWLERSTSKSCR